MSDPPRKLWENEDAAASKIEVFRREANKRHGLTLGDYHDLWQWSTDDINNFWMLVWSFTGVVATTEPTYAINESESCQMFPRPTWFPGARLKFAQNILESPYTPQDEWASCLTSLREGGSEIENVTLHDLRRRVGELANALTREGLQIGDRIACIAANSINTFVVFLAAASLGCIFTSCSPDIGEKGVLDRFTQVNPRILFADDAQLYNGKRLNCPDKIIAVFRELRARKDLKKTVLLARHAYPVEMAKPDITRLSHFVAGASSDLKFAALRFDDPLLMVYSSGTIGQPKCLVHTVGGVILKQKLEQILCTDMGPGSIHLQYTTTSWIMYLYAISGLLSGAKSILYDGSPMKPSTIGFLELLAQQRVTHFGTSAHYLNLLQQEGVTRHSLPNLDRLRVITRTGSVLAEGQFDWIYNTFGNIQLSSIAGGTDIAGAFVGGAPNHTPIRASSRPPLESPFRLRPSSNSCFGVRPAAAPLQTTRCDAN